MLLAVVIWFRDAGQCTGEPCTQLVLELYCSTNFVLVCHFPRAEQWGLKFTGTLQLLLDGTLLHCSDFLLGDQIDWKSVWVAKAQLGLINKLLSLSEPTKTAVVEALLGVISHCILPSENFVCIVFHVMQQKKRIVNHTRAIIC